MDIVHANRARLLLQLTYTIAPIAIGLDKCFTWYLTNWSAYTSPMVFEYLPAAVTISQFIMITGIIEIIAGILVWFYPKFGAYLVAAWMILVIANLTTLHGFYDIIARDVVITAGAIALAWLS